MKSSKKVTKVALAGLLVLAMGVTTLFTHVGSSYAAGEAKLNETSRNILTQRSFDFDVKGAPAGADITWKSSNEKVASVDEDGVVTGIKKGNVTITCEISSKGKKQKLTAKVTVCKPAVKIEIKNEISELEYGKKHDLDRTLTPRKSNDVTTWTSSDTSIATVDKNGVVTALNDGYVTITATTLSGRSDSVEIMVFGAPEPTPTPEPTSTPAPTQAPDATATPVPTEAPKPTEVPKPTATPKPTPKPAKQEVVYSESFENGLTGWTGRGGSESLGILQSVSSPDGMKYLTVGGRSQNWHGASISMNKTLEVGGVYSVSAWVKQNSKDGEVIKATTAKNGGEAYIQINEGGVITKKGEWTEITGQIIVAEDTTDLIFYFEADTPNLDFMVDHIVIKKVSGGKGLIYQPVKMESNAITYKATDIGYYGWDSKYEPKNGVMDVQFTKQYDGFVLMFPEAITVGDFSKMYVKMSTTDKVGCRLIDEADQEIVFWWNIGPMDMDTVTLDYGKTGYNANEAVSSAALAKKAKGLVIMNYGEPCDALIESISLVPAK